ncbi:hypothetical protein NBH00_18465 [Paraconexibacter antarcticus]|uniref:Phospholipase D-like domain-containing protein n=1 Tax=Paraconexibacter antarcticus TaxID=2949664 RepID=A0ABY5DRF1_9ACTN|nr:hypothetical protein [Paraconexibacter antarcticus]UTI63327.1 hypothetical protein NBH00_18465 [Paraconexibacter antarcticus]
MRQLQSAQQLVDAAYLVSELFGGEARAREWLKRLDSAGTFTAAAPTHMTPANVALLVGEMTTAGVVHDDGTVDEYRLDDMDQVFQLLPFVRAAEQARIPDPVSALVCTVPPQVVLPPRLRPLARSLSTLVADSLRSAEEQPLLLMSPYWSREGCQALRPAMDRALAQHLPVTLAGARPRDSTHHSAMTAFGARLRADGFRRVTVYEFAPPHPDSICHAKAVCGRTGYLGSGNLTVAGLERHVEVGLPLRDHDVERVWWLVDLLVEAKLLVEV